MKIPISKRLLACCEYIKKGDRVADIGTDHGYLGIWLLDREIARSVIAADIVPGPLSSARKNADKFGYTEQMEFYLSDGAQNIPKDFDVMVCAGMGADTIISIFEASAWLHDGKYRFVLQCQSKTAQLRKYLSENGFAICNESILRDGRFLYTVMEVQLAPAAPLTPGQWYLSPALLQNNCPELQEYYDRTVKILETATTKGATPADPSMCAALEELKALPQNPEYKHLTEDA